MSWRITALTAVIVVAAMLLAGCPQKTSTEATKTETTVQPAAPPAPAGAETKTAEPAALPTAEEEGETKTAETAEAAPTGDVAALVQDRCTQCHGIDKVEKEKADAEGWAKIVGEMQRNAEKMKKTPITDEEAKQIVDHILATYAQ